jgi:hypothetical protein
VLPGVYNVALVVDGKTVGTRPLRVMADPEVVLTDAERRRLFDMAMEMHDLQKRGAEIAGQIAPFTTRMSELEKEIGGRSDLPADVKSSFESLNKELTALVARFQAGGGGRGGRGGGGGGGRGGGPGDANNPFARAAQAKNGLMAGMWPTELTMRAYNDAKTLMPKTIAEINTLFVKAATLSGTLAKHNITLTPPPPLKVPTGTR